MFWVLFFGLLLVTLIFILVPLFRYRNKITPPADNNLDVYKAQLSELEADQENGIVSEAEAASARLEIERRLLRVAEGNDTAKKQALENMIPKNYLALASAFILIVTSGLYFIIGSPGMPDFALKDQSHSMAKLAARDSGSENIINEVAKVRAYLQANPNDAEAWHALGQYSVQLKDKAMAASSFQRWYELSPNNVEAAVIYAESLIVLSDGQIGPAASLVFNKARRVDFRNPGLRHYTALAQYQAGNVEQALNMWKTLETDSADDAPWLPHVKSWVRRAERDLGISTTANDVAPTISPSDKAAIEQMSDEEQSAMIKSMVARLQEKMDQNPDNIEGWFRLAKAYMVLGQKEDVIKSLNAAYSHAPDNIKADIKKQLDILQK
ncbi:MAG: c-type cytochrome biogenesis protein CcmI [Emcibacter sp.]|nr:c-type cytochrome biogenesis protein CcmI [Emcibacter sp.]